MPFQKGNKLANGRPQGSKNKSTDVDKEKIQQMLFNFESMQKEWQQFNVHKKFDIRTKAMPFYDIFHLVIFQMKLLFKLKIRNKILVKKDLKLLTFLCFLN